jgi:hypothetical protein
MTASRIVLIAVGVVTALLALALVAAGGTLGWAYLANRDDDGYFMTRHERLATPTYALVSDNLDIDDSTPNWLLDQVGKVRIDVDPKGKDAFVGIARTDDVDRYLGAVPHDRVVDLDFDPFSWESERAPGTRPPPGPPARRDFWAASESGAEPFQVDWDVESGDWVAVAMNDDAARGVNVSVAVGAKAPILLPIGIGLLVVGLLLGVAAFFIFRLSARSGRAARAPTP